MKRRSLDWLGHFARMTNERIPKSLLFEWLLEARPRLWTYKKMERCSGYAKLVPEGSAERETKEVCDGEEKADSR